MWPPCPPGAPTQRRPYSGSPRPSRHPGIESGGMELISTHLGADFDAFASMLAARRLHPGAELFFPGSREGSLRRTIEARRIEVPELRHRDVDPAELGERDVLLPRVDGVEDAVDLVPEALVPMKMTVLGQPEIAFEVVVGEAGLPQQAL